jgi:hypothetical protein
MSEKSDPNGLAKPSFEENSLPRTDISFMKLKICHVYNKSLSRADIGYVNVACINAEIEQGCSVLYGNALIRPAVADIASPDLKSPSHQGLKSPSYQGLTLVSPGVDAHGSLNPKLHDIREVGAGRCQDQVWHDDRGA